ncbi:hypothetical protein CIK05_11940 [Bdellovibrio sp. qaytius]|nr:hypothetical protein CIK05_11940 [Bdellovibrio sp. qaytius]
MNKVTLILTMILSLKSLKVAAEAETPSPNTIAIVVDKDEAQALYESLKTKAYTTLSGLVKIECAAKEGVIYGKNYECLISYDLSKISANEEISSKDHEIKLGTKALVYRTLTFHLNENNAQDICNAFETQVKKSKFNLSCNENTATIETELDPVAKDSGATVNPLWPVNYIMYK